MYEAVTFGELQETHEQLDAIGTPGAEGRIECALVVEEFRRRCHANVDEIMRLTDGRLRQLRATLTRLKNQKAALEENIRKLFKESRIAADDAAANHKTSKAWGLVSALAGKSGSVNWEVPAPTVQVTADGEGLPYISGIYFVWHKNRKKCVYVGQSICIAKRAIIHAGGCRSDGRIYKGEWISWLAVDVYDLDFAECFYIGVLRPERNFGRSARAQLR